MEERCLRGYTRDPGHPQSVFQERSTSILIAIPFVVCFSVFGIFNLVGGTVLTIMSCKPRFSPKALITLQKLVKSSSLKFETYIDPMRVVGIMLLVTGSLLVVIGLSLGIIACRSVSEQKRRRQERIGLPLYSLVDRCSRRTSSFGSTSFVSGRGKNNGKKALEKTVSPILEASGEEESIEGERLAVEVHVNNGSHTSIKDMSPTISVQTVHGSPNPHENDMGSLL